VKILYITSTNIHSCFFFSLKWCLVTSVTRYTAKGELGMNNFILVTVIGFVCRSAQNFACCRQILRAFDFCSLVLQVCTILFYLTVKLYSGWMISGPLFSGGTEFKSRPEDRQSWGSHEFTQSLQAYVGIDLRLSHGRFYPHSFLLIHHSTLCCITWGTGSVCK
jgi:hypothetical protein